MKTVMIASVAVAALSSTADAQRFYARQQLQGVRGSAPAAPAAPSGYAKCGAMESGTMASKNPSASDVTLVATNDSLNSPAEALAWCQAQKLPDGEVGWGCRYIVPFRKAELRSAGPIAAAAGTERYDNPNVFSAVCQ